MKARSSSGFFTLRNEKGENCIERQHLKTIKFHQTHVEPRVFPVPTFSSVIPYPVKNQKGHPKMDSLLLNNMFHSDSEGLLFAPAMPSRKPPHECSCRRISYAQGQQTSS